MGEQTETMKNRRAIIVGAAPGELPLSRLDIVPEDILICADGGRDKLEGQGLTPDWYVGDNDSGGSPEGLPSVLLPAEKDVSDLEMALDKALELGCGRIVFIGCTGGRMDHALANLSLLVACAERGVEAALIDMENEVRFLGPGSYRIANEPAYRYLGLIPLDWQVEGLTLTGVKYPLQNFNARCCSTRTISNEILPGKQAEISFTAGRMLLIRSLPIENS